MKKHIQLLLSCFLSLALFCTASFSAVAKDLNDLSTTRYYAYMDFDRADSITKAKIVEARNKLIYAESWSADGIDAYVTDLEGNIIEKLPEFSELFPTDWSVPDVLPEAEIHPQISPYSAMTESTTEPLNYTDTVYLKKPPETANSKPFRTISTTRYIEDKIRFETVSINSFTQIVPGATYNLGYTNLNTGSDLAHKTNLTSGEGLCVYPPKNIRVGIRASSYNIGGSYEFFTYEICTRTVLK